MTRVTTYDTESGTIVAAVKPRRSRKKVEDMTAAEIVSTARANAGLDEPPFVIITADQVDQPGELADEHDPSVVMALEAHAEHERRTMSDTERAELEALTKTTLIDPNMRNGKLRIALTQAEWTWIAERRMTQTRHRSLISTLLTNKLNHALRENYPLYETHGRWEKCIPLYIEEDMASWIITEIYVSLLRQGIFEDASIIGLTVSRDEVYNGHIPHEAAASTSAAA